MQNLTENETDAVVGGNAAIIIAIGPISALYAAQAAVQELQKEQED